MKFLIVAVVVGLMAVTMAEEEKYDTKFDNVDWKSILANDRLTRNYIDCVLGKKSCPTDGAYLKSVIPDALQTDCSKCSEKQREAAKYILTTLYKKKNEWFKELETAFDKEHVYFNKYKTELE